MSDLQWALNEAPISSSKANKLGVPKWTTSTRDAKADADLVVGMLIWNVTTNKLQKLKQLTPTRIWVDILDTDDRGVANGVASLDGSTKVPLTQLQEVLGLTDLSDALISSPTDKEVLQYETSSGLWKNKLAGGGIWNKLIDETISGEQPNTSTFAAKQFLHIWVYWTTTINIGYIVFNADQSALYAYQLAEGVTRYDNWSDTRGIQVHRAGSNLEQSTELFVYNYSDKHKRVHFRGQRGAYNGQNWQVVGSGIFGTNTQVTKVGLEDFNAGTIAARVVVEGWTP